MAAGPAILATRSAGKLRELRPLFAEHGVEVIDLAEAGLSERAEEDDLEIFDTFEGNALAKATHFHRRSGMPVFADDSGLQVRALGGAPGVRSKRWSGRPDLSGQALDEENNRFLLEKLERVADRAARYVCAAAYVDASGAEVRRGEVDGLVVEAPRGEGGFGYDPYFFSTELGRTFGEASRVEKETVSHRGRAFRALLGAVASRLGQ
jgi:XTP/dITP diphosphohydrolase